jgi:hypothetical protein
MGTKPFPIAVNVAGSLSRIELSEQDILSRLTNTEDSRLRCTSLGSCSNNLRRTGS